MLKLPAVSTSATSHLQHQLSGCLSLPLISHVEVDIDAVAMALKLPLGEASPIVRLRKFPLA